jgi:hypothetical protein
MRSTILIHRLYKHDEKGVEHIFSYLNKWMIINKVRYNLLRFKDIVRVH